MSKKGYSIGEVAKLIGVETHTVRFWSNELEELFSPNIGAGNRRYYSESDISCFKKVKELVHQKGYRLGFIKKNGLSNGHSLSCDHSSLSTIITNIEKQISTLMNDI